jgi:hypothetical protein
VKKRAKSKVVGKHPHHAKPAAPVHHHKHAAGAASKKHAVTAHQKHLAHLAHLAHIGKLKHVAKPAPKKRGLALGDAVACCAAEALAASLRLSGLSVSDADVLALHRLSGADDEAGGTILAALEAASEFTMAGYRPVFEEVMPPDRLRRLLHAVPEPNLSSRVTGAGLVLGVDLPGPHTVLATPDGWWSWGELHCPCEFPDAVIEEAWAVTWG